MELTFTKAQLQTYDEALAAGMTHDEAYSLLGIETGPAKEPVELSPNPEPVPSQPATRQAEAAAEEGERLRKIAEEAEKAKIRANGGVPLDEYVDSIGRVVHEANRAYRQMIGEEPGESWEAAPKIVTDSVRSGILDYLNGENPNPEESHARWYNYKLAEGWEYGPVKDVEKKQHPCMVPYEHLPAEQKVKDHLFRAIVGAITGR